MKLLRRRLALRHLITLILCTLCLTALVGSGLSESGSPSRRDSTAERGGGRGMRKAQPNDGRYVSVVYPGEPKLVASPHSTASKVFEQQAPSQKPQQTDVRELNLGQLIERELAGGEAHTYRIALTAGQYLKVV